MAYLQFQRASAAAPTVPQVSNPTLPPRKPPTHQPPTTTDMGDDSPAPAAVPTRPGFRALIEEEIARVDMDDEDNDPLFPGPSLGCH